MTQQTGNQYRHLWHITAFTPPRRSPEFCSSELINPISARKLSVSRATSGISGERVGAIQLMALTPGQREKELSNGTFMQTSCQPTGHESLKFIHLVTETGFQVLFFPAPVLIFCIFRNKELRMTLKCQLISDEKELHHCVKFFTDHVTDDYITRDEILRGGLNQ